MLVGNIGYLIKIVIFILYIIFNNNKIILPDTFLAWVWIIYITYALLNYFAYCMQDTIRNIARIYLIKKHGLIYKKENQVKLQNLLIPDSMVLITIIWQIFEVLAFTFILFYQGMVIAICSDLLLYVLLAIIPIHYNIHLRMINKYLGELGSKSSIYILIAGFEFLDLKSLVDKAINEKINPHKWWSIIRTDAQKEDCNDYELH